MDRITRRNVIGAGVATGALLLSGVRPAFAAPPLTWTQFTQHLNDYMAANFEEVRSACCSPGGWEKWFQTELALWIVKQDSTYDVWRERHVYIKPLDSVDFLFNDGGSFPLLIELKCQTFHSAFSKNKADYEDQTSTVFLKLLADDEQKLEKKYLKDQYKKAARYVVGATMEDLNLPGYTMLSHSPQQSNNNTNNNTNNNANATNGNNNMNTRTNNNINSTNNNTNSMQLDPPLRIYYKAITG